MRLMYMCKINKRRLLVFLRITNITLTFTKVFNTMYFIF